MKYLKNIGKNAKRAFEDLKTVKHDKIKKVLDNYNKALLKNKDKIALSKAITVIENRLPNYQNILSDSFSYRKTVQKIGITGPPGAGKSTITNQLCKDFLTEPYQVYLARSFGADAILIILAAINEKTAKEIYNVAEELNMSTIVETHIDEEAKKALDYKNAIIGINNRNLKTLKTDIKTTYDLHKILIEHSGPLVCESGIKSEKEVEEIVKKTKINNFLIGESLLKDLDKNSLLLKKITQIRP